MKTSGGKRWVPKLQFSLRWFLIFATLTCVTIGVYFSLRSVAFPVPAVMQFDEQTSARVAEVVEHQAPWIADSVRHNASVAKSQAEITYGLSWRDDVTPEMEAARVKFLLGDLDRIYHRHNSDYVLIDQHESEFVAAALRAQAAPKSFRHAASAAAVLAHFGDSTQLNEMVDLYIANGQLDHELYNLCLCFDREQTTTEPDFIEALKAQIANANCSDQYRLTFAEQLLSVDESILAAVSLDVARNTKIDSVREKSIAWLIENNGDTESWQLAISFLEAPENLENWYDCGKVVHAVLVNQSLQKQDSKTRARIMDLVQGVGRKHDQGLRAIVDHGGQTFESYFRAIVAKPETRISIAAGIDGAEAVHYRRRV